MDIDLEEAGRLLFLFCLGFLLAMTIPPPVLVGALLGTNLLVSVMLYVQHPGHGRIASLTGLFLRATACELLGALLYYLVAP